MNVQNAYCFIGGNFAPPSTVNRMVAGSSPAQGASFLQHNQRLGSCPQGGEEAHSVAHSVDRSASGSATIARGTKPIDEATKRALGHWRALFWVCTGTSFEFEITKCDWLDDHHWLSRIPHDSELSADQTAAIDIAQFRRSGFGPDRIRYVRAEYFPEYA